MHLMHLAPLTILLQLKQTNTFSTSLSLIAFSSCLIYSFALNSLKTLQAPALMQSKHDPVLSQANARLFNTSFDILNIFIKPTHPPQLCQSVAKV